MAKSKYKEEKKSHDSLLELLKEHFMEDEQDLLEGGEEMEDMKPMSTFMKMKRGKMYGDQKDEDIEYEGEEEDDYSEEGVDDDYYEDLMEEDDDEDMKLPKDKRKNLAVMIITKKAGRKK